MGKLYTDEDTETEYYREPKQRMTAAEEKCYTKQFKPCERCDGTGWVRTAAPVMGEDQILHPIKKRREKCPGCNGTGKWFDQKRTFE